MKVEEIVGETKGDFWIDLITEFNFKIVDPVPLCVWYFGVWQP